MHLVSRDAYEIAETQFRRAIWLNPFEPMFRVHLAWCLHKLTRHAEALECLQDVASAELSDDLRDMVVHIQRGISGDRKI
jgi:hypothetical protein